MPKKRQQHTKFAARRFLISFWGIVAALLILKLLFPQIAPSAHVPTVKEAKEIIKKPFVALASDHARPAEVDTIEEAAARVDSIFLRPRKAIALVGSDGKPLHHSFDRNLPYATLFNDLNDVHLATAERLGQPECKNRQEAAAHKDRYVYVGASPYYDLEALTYSVPYLVPRAAILLDEIGHAFLDSLTAKGLPFHKMVVTSLLRTDDDVARLRVHNRNASEQSAHRFGTTFDIAYTHFCRVQDPDDEPQVETYARDLKAILGEVLRDQKELGTCYVKYEYRQTCFHITCR